MLQVDYLGLAGIVAEIAGAAPMTTRVSRTDVTWARAASHHLSYLWAAGTLEQMSRAQNREIMLACGPTKCCHAVFVRHATTLQQ